MTGRLPRRHKACNFNVSLKPSWLKGSLFLKLNDHPSSATPSEDKIGKR